MRPASLLPPVALGALLCSAVGYAQTAPAPGHQHYQKPAGYDQAAAPGMPLAPRLQNLGAHTFTVTTSSGRAQLFVNQGLNLAYGFNHAEAFRAFAEAARLDPACAMAYWGQALVLGPNLNPQMNADDEPKAYAIPNEALGTVPILQGFLVVPYWAMVRFGEWDAILADNGPRHDTTFTRGAWRYARAMALTAKGRLGDTERELAALLKLVNDPTLKTQVTFSTNTGIAILRIAPEVVAGEIAARRKNWDAALLHLERAARYEDALIYQEPSDWHAPVRQNLGAVLLAAGRADEAEAVYWEDLRKNPATGWALFGLMQALKAQGKNDEATLAEQRFREAWKDADITLTASRIGS